MINTGEVALVTGGASGMGQITARRLAAKGAKVAIFDLNEQGLADTAAESENITAYRCDISNLDEVQARVKQVTDELGTIELLVHAAALMPAHALIDHTHADMERLFKINYLGTVYMVRTVIDEMLTRGRGRVIAFGSIAGIALVPKMGAYCATKAAVNAYMEVLQNEIRNTGVRAHLVCPPAVNTPLVDQTIETDTPASIVEAKKSGRLGDPEKMIDGIEKGVAKDRDIIYPAEAKLLYFWRALLPKLWWKTVMSFENKKK